MTDTRQPDDIKVREAALNAGESFIVQAPAGSGKTDLLIKRFLRLLATVDKPEAILAITFTRKAAAEMRQRVLDALRNADETAKDDNEARLRELARAARDRDAEQHWQLSDNPARLRIQTIDSFNAELTRQLPLLAKFGAQPQITETPNELYEEAVRKTLDEIESGAQWSGAIAALLNHLDNDWHKTHGLLMAMLPKREQWLAHIKASTDRDHAEHALANEITHQLEKLRASIPADNVNELVSLATFAANNTAPEENVIANCRDLQALPEATVTALPQWQGLAELLLTKDGGWRKQLNKNQGMPPDAKDEKSRVQELIRVLSVNDNCRRQLHNVRALPHPEYAPKQWQLIEALNELLPLAVGQLKVVFGAHGKVDFTEMALRAKEALGADDEPTDLALRLDYRISHILVDEFQDTSVIQNELLKLLTAGWQPDDGRSLFLVGDPMQSIYRFRAAEVGLFLETASHGLGDIHLTPLQLTTNFRSQAGIVDWVNEGFSQILPQQSDIASGAVPYAASNHWHNDDPASGVAVYPQFGNDQHAEAEQVLDIIRQDVGPDTTTAVLVQTRNHLAALIPLLRQQGIQYRAMEIERLGGQPVVLDLLALTQALVHPADRISWLSVLHAPWCGLTRYDLHALAAQHPEATGPELLQADSSTMSDDGRARLDTIRAVFDTVLANTRRQSLRNTVESTWYALGGPAAVASSAALDDADAFFNLLERMEAGGDLDNGGALVRELEQLFAPPDTAAGNNLQIMTVHKAKGLEFDRVIIPGLGRRPRHDDPQLLLWQIRQREHGSDLLIAPLTAAGDDRDPIYQFLQSLEKERGTYERGRLLYVACTRAKCQLHLLGHVNLKEKNDGTYEIKPPQSGSALSLLWPQLEATYQEALADYQPDKPATDEQLTKTHTPQRLPLNWNRPSLPEAVALPEGMNATAESETPIEFSWASETARMVGIVVHRLLQRIAKDGADAWTQPRLEQLQPTVEAMFIQQGLPAEQRASATQQVNDALANMLADERGRWILDNRHEEAESELALARVNNGRLESVVLDRTFIDKDGTRWIIDYKTGSHAGGDVDTFLDREQERYQPQLERYAEFI